MKKYIAFALIFVLFAQSALALAPVIEGFTEVNYSIDELAYINSVSEDITKALFKADIYALFRYEGIQSDFISFDELAQDSKKLFSAAREADLASSQMPEEWPTVTVVFSDRFDGVKIEYDEPLTLTKEELEEIEGYYRDTDKTAAERIENGGAALYSLITQNMKMKHTEEGKELLKVYGELNPDFKRPVAAYFYAGGCIVLTFIVYFVLKKKSA